MAKHWTTSRVECDAPLEREYGVSISIADDRLSLTCVAPEEAVDRHVRSEATHPIHEKNPTFGLELMQISAGTASIPLLWGVVDDVIIGGPLWIADDNNRKRNAILRILDTASPNGGAPLTAKLHLRDRSSGSIRSGGRIPLRGCDGQEIGIALRQSAKVSRGQYAAALHKIRSEFPASGQFMGLDAALRRACP